MSPQIVFEMTSPRNKTITASEEEVSSFEEGNGIICGNLFSRINDIPDKSIDLLLTDPPYNISKDFGSVRFSKTTSDNYKTFTDKWLDVVVPKLKDNASVYICCDWGCSCEIKQSLEEHGMHILNRITWKREKGRGSKKNWKNCSEDIWYAVKNKNDYYFDVSSVMVKKSVIAPYRDAEGKAKDWFIEDGKKYRYTYPSNIWTDIVVPFWSMPENTEHPTQKPEELFRRLILVSCPEGGTVFDPFLGSGTTLVVAKNTGRIGIGIEKDKKWCTVAKKRLL